MSEILDYIIVHHSTIGACCLIYLCAQRDLMKKEYSNNVLSKVACNNMFFSRERQIPKSFIR